MLLLGEGDTKTKRFLTAQEWPGITQSRGKSLTRKADPGCSTIYYLALEKMIQFRKVTSIPALKINCPASLVMLMQKQLLLVFCIKSVLLHSFDSLCRMAEMSTDQGPKSPHTKSHYTRKPPTCALLLLARLTSFHSKIIGKICCVPTSTPAAHANFLCSNPWEHVVLKASQ